MKYLYDMPSQSFPHQTYSVQKRPPPPLNHTSGISPLKKNRPKNECDKKKSFKI